jgi:hypothetical protein
MSKTRASGPSEPGGERRSRRVCPRCGSRDSVRIVFGYPSPELFEEARQGKVALGGCLIDVDNPTRECRACEHRWTAAGDSPY